MSRFSPTVLPRAFDFGGILERALQGYRYGRGLRRERREEREREEEQDRQRSALRSYHLSQPGAATLGEYLETELGAGREPLTKETRRRAGRADEPEVEMEFRRPEPTTVTLPGGETRQFQERAPFTTETDVVIDPRRAREESGLAAYMDASMLRQPTRKPWEREGFETEPEYLDFVRGKSKAEGAGRARTAAEARPISYPQALDAVDQLYPRIYDETTQKHVGALSEQARDAMARALMRGEPLPAVPQPPVRALPSAGLFEFGSFADFLGRGADREGAEPEGPPAPGSRIDVPPILREYIRGLGRREEGGAPEGSPPQKSDTIGRYSRAVADSLTGRRARVSQARALLAQPEYADLNLSAAELEGWLADEGFTPEEIRVILGGGRP